MMRLRLLAAIASFVWIPAAQAHTIVWFETPNIFGNSPVGGFGGGGAGQSLNLICEPSGPSACTWQIHMKAALGEGGVVGWSLDLRTAPGNGVSILNPQVPAGTPFNQPAWPGTPGSGPSLLFDAYGQTFTPPQPQTLTLLTFTLRRNFSIGDLTIAAVQGGPSSDFNFGWFNNATGDCEVVQFGPNAPAMAIAGTIPPLQLITIVSPEPASLSLLAIGAVVCLRRRRA